MRNMIATLSLCAAICAIPVNAVAEDITERVLATLAEHPAAASLNLKVAREGDAVVLDGEVDDYALADQAVVAIAKLPGVTTIVNRIRTRTS